MADEDKTNPTKKANQYIFAGVGAVFGGIAGAGVAGIAAAAAGVVLGGLIGYNMLRKL
jgi:hypothetical protein